LRIFSGDNWTPNFLEATIRRGAVYKFVHFLVSEKPHFFTLLNCEANDEYPLYFLMATSKVEKLLNRARSLKYPRKTIVIVDPEENDIFDKKTAFNCNVLYEFKLEEFLQEYKKIQLVGYLKGEIIKSLIQGCIDSPLIEPYIKNFLNKPCSEN